MSWRRSFKVTPRDKKHWESSSVPGFKAQGRWCEVSTLELASNAVALDVSLSPGHDTVRQFPRLHWLRYTDSCAHMWTRGHQNVQLPRAVRAKVRGDENWRVCHCYLLRSVLGKSD
jgi:hypothetical protein